MKRYLWRTFILAGLLFQALGFSLEYEIAFTQGAPYLRAESGREEDLYVGDLIKVGDTIITKKNDSVELKTQGITVVISENTVFTVYAMERAGKSQDVLGCLFGKIKMSVEEATAGEPILMSNSTVCGVRGTEIILMSAADGSSLVLVTAGRVNVSAQGSEVELVKGEGVEIEVGAAPGEKFSVENRQIDFSSWSEGKKAELLDAPLEFLAKAEKRMAGFVAEIRRLSPLWKDSLDRVRSERENLKRIRDELGEGAATEYHKTVIAPLQYETTRLILNIRFYALSALSLRRYVLGRLYLLLKARYMTNPQDEFFRSYLAKHARIVDLFEKEILPEFIAKADI